MKRKIRHLDAIKHGSSLYSLNTLSVNPLTIAVYSVLAGMSLTASADTTTQSPSTIDATLPLPNGNNRVTSFTTSPATITVTSSGVVNYPDADTNLSCSKLFVDGSNDGNSITSYGTINGSTNNQYQSNLMGAYTNLNAAVQGNVQGNNNTVTFKAGSSTKNLTVYGAQIIDDYSGNAVTASGNTVFIENGSEFLGNKMITGGYAGGNGSSTASNNKVILGSGTYSSTIYGGWAYGQTQVNISNNTVYLYGDANVSAAGIYGGETNWYINAVTLTGNTLVFGYNNTPWTPSSYTIGNVKNFSTIRFDNVVWGKTITINFFANKSTDSTVTKIDATKVAFSGVDSLSSGDSYDMLTIEELNSGSLALSSETSTYTVGTTLEGTGKVSLSENGKTVTYTVDSASEKASSQSHAAAMTMSAGTVALTQGADTTSAAGFNLANSGITGVQSFSSVGGGAARVETGSFVSLKTLNFSVGIGNNVQNDYGLLSIGGAFEAGYGKFKNHFDAGAADPYIKKTGHVSYYGLALLSNFTFENLWHVNGAVRVGRMESTQNNALYNAATGETYDINIGTNYYGLELGGGKLIKIDDTNSLDIYGKYFYLYQASDSFNAGGKYKLSAVNSNRLRVAGRYSHDFTPVTSLYGGAGLEHEFDGKSKLKVDDKAWAKSSKTKGTRAFGEIGVAVKPASNTGLILDFSVKGLYGDNFRGAWASADIKYMF
ncbi:autotransporter domain-containing protein [Succinivibrio dextrinosolvens]|nr:autotransporter domain-containing protein [Succinivibrio dextrinosolvens]